MFQSPPTLTLDVQCPPSQKCQTQDEDSRTRDFQPLTFKHKAFLRTEDFYKETSQIECWQDEG
ncbi:hypothetical protein BGE01nite_55170 [Brevifollis gellanilyticus]|uniref:Uncharacterized protein n=1 Tax=Brevifollis gellanilyticus TaxID=748831 RepID=A0A512MHL9_9BACT|nr:hypothetical protein BGE01nite_55170 [Brevifollis gellanilyticus]